MNCTVRIFTCCCSLLLPLFATAKEPRRGDLAVRLLADHVPGDLGEVRLVAGNKKSDPFHIPVNALTSGVVAPDRSFEVRPAAGGEAMTTVELPPKGKSFVVLLASTEGGFTPVVVPSADRAFKGGDVYFFNNSGKTITGLLGETAVTVETGKGAIVRPKIDSSKSAYQVSLSVREESGDRALSRTAWPVDAKIRSFVFFFVNPKTKRIDFRAVDEFVGK